MLVQVETCSCKLKHALASWNMLLQELQNVENCERAMLSLEPVSWNMLVPRTANVGNLEILFK